uniref:cyclin-T1-4-like n=1 Tax=Fragaria vesca subsp. vesca TaxID=101020 RepID=UPI0005CA8B35|nr:PREDICTED: cyclin-T1-4-like [Fragaria vesca subsp. vesca]
MSRSWYFTSKELEHNSPSRRDSITVVKESKLRSLYCSHIQKVGQNLRLPHLTIATAMMLCHRFYARQSHAKNCWHTVASACVLLASKVQDTPRSLKDVVYVVYGQEIQYQINEMMKNYQIKHPHDVTKCDEYAIKIVELLKRDKRELIAKAERLVLKTIGFDLDIELPFKALAAALKRLTSDVVPRLAEVAWSLVEEWLKTSLCLQYKPKYIAVGSVVVAARVLNVKLPAGEKWLEELGVLPEVLDEVVRWMQSKICKQKTKETIRVVSFYEIITCRPLDSKA